MREAAGPARGVAAARTDAGAGAQRLERDEPPELAIAGLALHPEAAAAALAEKLEPADDATRPQRGRRPFRHIGAREVLQELRKGTRRRTGVRRLRSFRSALRIVRQVAPRESSHARYRLRHIAVASRRRHAFGAPPAVPTAGRVLATEAPSRLFEGVLGDASALPHLERACFCGQLDEKLSSMRLESAALCAVFALSCGRLLRPERPGVESPRPATLDGATKVRGANDSVSIGSPSEGRLEHGVPLPLEGAGFRQRPKSHDRRYGTAELVGALVRAARAVQEALPGSELTIDDLSVSEGGDIPGHASHRNGRDVDVSFYLLGENGKPRGGDSIPLDPEGRGTDYEDLEDPADDEPVVLDVPRTWKFVEALLLDEEVLVQRIFVVEHLRTMLLEHARRIHAPERAIGLFAEVTCQPSFPHDDHMHIRVFCTAEDVSAGCEDTHPIYPRQRARLADAGVELKLAQLRKGPRPPLVSHTQARARAGSMHQSVIDFLVRREAWLKQPHPGRRYCP